MATEASEVIGREQRGGQSSRLLGVIPLAALWLVALAFLVGDNSGALERTLLAPGAFLAGLICFAALAWGLPRLDSSGAIEISADTIRWHGGIHRRARVIRRWQVLATRGGGGRRPSELSFHDAVGHEVGVVPLTHFRTETVVAALRRNNWPLPSSGDLTDRADQPDRADAA